MQARPLLTLALLSITGSTFASERYSLTDLGSLERPDALAAGLNNSGECVGFGFLADGSMRAARFSTLGAEDLGTLGGDSVATAINDAGHIVGSSAPVGGFDHAVLYSQGTMHDLGTLSGGESKAASINSSDQVVGTAYAGGGIYHGFLYTDGAMQDLGNGLGGGSNATAINDAGVIAGSAFDPRFYNQAAIWSGGTMTPLGTLGGVASYALGINNLSQVVGSSYPVSGNSRAFMWANGTMHDLGSLYGFDETVAESINDLGQVVGYSGRDSKEAVLFEDGEALSLNSLLDPFASTWYLAEAKGINNRGEIVANAYNAEGRDRVVLLTPVPEPSTFIGLGIFSVLALRRARPRAS